MTKTNLFKSISVITDNFLSKKGDTLELSARGSNILLFSLIQDIQKKGDIHFEVYQQGMEDSCIQFKGITVHMIKCNSFLDFKKKLKEIKFNTDIVHYNNIDFFSGKIPNTYLTATIHTNSFLEKEDAKEWLHENIGLLDEVVVVNSEYMKEFKGTILIKNGIAKEIFEYNSKERNRSFPVDILFPNLNTFKKNRDFAINLVKELNSSSKYQFRLILVGEKEELSLRDEEYKFVEEKSWGKEMNRLYKESFITIIPSFSESCSLCALESMSSGTVVIANDIFGIRDYVKDGKNGCLIDVRDMDEWKKRIFSLVIDSKEYARIQQNARNTVIKEYNSERMSKEYYSMWLRLFEKRNG